MLKNDFVCARCLFVDIILIMPISCQHNFRNIIKMVNKHLLMSFQTDNNRMSTTFDRDSHILFIKSCYRKVYIYM